jgi:hypothetical protein
MTVAELIAKLQEMPQDARVVIDGYEEGVEDVQIVQAAPVVLNVNPVTDTMYGTHELQSRLSDRTADEIAVYLPRRLWPQHPTRSEPTG